MPLPSVLLDAHAPRVDGVRILSRRRFSHRYGVPKASTNKLQVIETRLLTADGSGVGGERTAHRGKPV